MLLPATRGSHDRYALSPTHVRGGIEVLSHKVGTTCAAMKSVCQIHQEQQEVELHCGPTLTSTCSTFFSTFSLLLFRLRETGDLVLLDVRCRPCKSGFTRPDQSRLVCPSPQRPSFRSHVKGQTQSVPVHTSADLSSLYPFVPQVALRPLGCALTPSCRGSLLSMATYPNPLSVPEVPLRPPLLEALSTLGRAALLLTCPFPKRPCVSTSVMTLSRPRSTCRNSYVSLETGCDGHHAPPFVSCRILPITRRYRT